MMLESLIEIEPILSRIQRLSQKVVMFIAPGSARSFLSEHLRNMGWRILTYKENGLTLDSITEAVERGEHTVVIFRDTLTSLTVKATLEEKGIEVGVVYLPALYLEHRRKEPPEYAKVDYMPLKNMVEKTKGISITLWREWNGKEEEVKKAVEAIRTLDPQRIGFLDLLRDAQGLAMPILPGTLEAILVNLTAGSALASLTAALVGFASPGLNKIAEGVGQFFGGFIPDIVKNYLERLAEKLTEIVSKRGEARRQYIEGLAKLLKAAKEAHEYLYNDFYEGIVDEIVLKWGLDLESFRNFVENLYKLTQDSVVTEEKLERFLKSIEAKLDELEKDLRMLEELFYVAREPSSLGIDLDTNELIIGWNRYKLAGFPRKWEEHMREIFEALKKGLIILHGSKGVGKSTYARYVLARALREGLTSYVLVIEDAGTISRAAMSAGKHNCIVLYDPSPPSVYEAGLLEYLSRELILA